MLFRVVVVKPVPSAFTVTRPADVLVNPLNLTFVTAPASISAVLISPSAILADVTASLSIVTV